MPSTRITLAGIKDEIKCYLECTGRQPDIIRISRSDCVALFDSMMTVIGPDYQSFRDNARLLGMPTPTVSEYYDEQGKGYTVYRISTDYGAVECVHTTRDGEAFPLNTVWADERLPVPPLAKFV